MVILVAVAVSVAVIATVDTLIALMDYGNLQQNANIQRKETKKTMVYSQHTHKCTSKMYLFCMHTENKTMLEFLAIHELILLGFGR